MASRIKSATPAEVKAWATAQGFGGFGSKGRIATATITAFNDAHKGSLKYSGKPEHVVSVKGFNVSASGRRTPVTRTVTMDALRAVRGVHKGRPSRADLLKAANLVG